jgi:hypothetical protein
MFTWALRLVLEGSAAGFVIICGLRTILTGTSIMLGKPSASSRCGARMIPCVGNTTGHDLFLECLARASRYVALARPIAGATHICSSLKKNLHSSQEQFPGSASYCSITMTSYSLIRGNVNRTVPSGPFSALRSFGCMRVKTFCGTLARRSDTRTFSKGTTR